eukprot:1155542-Pelagomonas_calceolata.AAC.2
MREDALEPAKLDSPDLKVGKRPLSDCTHSDFSEALGGGCGWRHRLLHTGHCEDSDAPKCDPHRPEEQGVCAE